MAVTTKKLDLEKYKFWLDVLFKHRVRFAKDHTVSDYKARMHGYYMEYADDETLAPSAIWQKIDEEFEKNRELVHFWKRFDSEK